MPISLRIKSMRRTSQTNLKNYFVPNVGWRSSFEKFSIPFHPKTPPSSKVRPLPQNLSFFMEALISKLTDADP